MGQLLTSSVLRQCAAPPRLALSTFEDLVEKSSPLASGHDRIFELLLGATCLPPAIAGWSHSAIWIGEALHRASSMLQLTLALRSQIGSPRAATAAALAGYLNSLAGASEDAIVPCSHVLREVVRNTTSLFSPMEGNLEVTTDVEYLGLSAYQRRALVLLASELAVNALLHAYRGRSTGLLSLSLQRIGAHYARLRVQDDGIGRPDGQPDTSRSVCGALASVLGAPLVYSRSHRWATIADVTFGIDSTLPPIAAPVLGHTIGQWSAPR